MRLKAALKGKEANSKLWSQEGTSVSRVICKPWMKKEIVKQTKVEEKVVIEICD